MEIEVWGHAVANSRVTVYVNPYYEEKWVNGEKVNALKYYTFGGQRVAVYHSSNASLKYLHSDHLGSASRVTSAAGEQVRSLRYEAWGNVVSDEGMSAIQYKYTGQEQDNARSYDYHARAYDPLLGRFLSADSIVPGAADGAGGGAATLGYDPRTRLTPLTVNLGEFAEKIGAENREAASWSGLSPSKLDPPIGSPQALNRYAYTLNNPLKYVDPSGHYVFEEDPSDPLIFGNASVRRSYFQWLIAKGLFTRAWRYVQQKYHTTDKLPERQVPGGEHWASDLPNPAKTEGFGLHTHVTHHSRNICRLC